MPVLGKAVRGTVGVATAIKDLARFRRIASVLVKHGFGFIFENVRVPGFQAARSEEESTALPIGVRMAAAAEELGATFVKLGQFLSTRPDLIPRNIARDLEVLQDRVSPEITVDMKAEVEAGLGGPIDRHFTHFKDEPIASASVAQVHEAVTVEGNKVAVKVLRPGVRKLIETDLSILSFLARQVEANFEELRFLDLPGIVQEFGRALRVETDLTHERRHLQRFASDFADNDDLLIPMVYPQHSGAAVLTMEFVEGVPARRAAETGFDLNRISRSFLDMAYSMLFEKGFFHADMHPGNIFVAEDGRLALLDCGMVGQLTPDMRDSLANLVFAVARNDVRTLARGFWELAAHREPVNYGAFERDVQRLMEETIGTSGRSLADIQFGALIGAVMEGAMAHRMTMPPDYMMFFKAIISAEGLARQLAPDVDPVAEASPWVEKLVKERYAPERLREDAVMLALELQQVARRAPQVVSQFIRSYTDGTLQVPVTVTEEASSRKARAREQYRLRAALVTMALVLAAALTIPHMDTSSSAEGFGRLRVWAPTLFFAALALLTGRAALSND